MRWVKAWIRHPVRMWLLWVMNVCPNCRCKSVAWGQWNDGAWAGKPICCNPNCPEPSPYEGHQRKGTTK